jgi:hypothetical protein
MQADEARSLARENAEKEQVLHESHNLSKAPCVTLIYAAFAATKGGFPASSGGDAGEGRARAAEARGT